MARHIFSRLTASVLSLSLATAAHALGIDSISPQGEAADVRQVVIRFKQPAVRFGDLAAAAPFSVDCDHPAAQGGSGRWTSEHEWVHDFRAALPGGIRCQLRPQPGFQSPDGQSLSAAAHHRFDTGGPRLQQLRPHPGQSIEEEQVFVLKLDTPATLASLQQHLHCRLPGLGEQVPVRLLQGAERQAILALPAHAALAGAISGREENDSTPTSGQPAGTAQASDAHTAVPTGQLLVVQCQRRFAAGSEITLVYGKGIASANGLHATQDRNLSFKIREPFRAEMSCERENAEADCLPIRPLSLRFSAPLTRSQAQGIRLEGGPAPLLPTLLDGTGRLLESRDADALVEAVRFEAPLAERTRHTLHLPEGLRDASGRPLANADSFPLTVATGPMPPLARFAAAPFGIVERLADGPGSTPTMPVSLRRVEADLAARRLEVSTLDVENDTDILTWLHRVTLYHEGQLLRHEVETDEAVQHPLPPPLPGEDDHAVDSRTLSLLGGRPATRTLALPPAPPGEPRPAEVLGIPLVPGFQVLEIASPLLGQALLDPRLGPQRTLYTRTAVLVTNLGLHVKLGRENALAWVTTLDQGKPVAGARVRVLDCSARVHDEATTGSDGIARFGPLPAEAPECNDGRHGYFFIARASDGTTRDLAFTWSHWDRGIEAWRFGVPTLDANDDRRRAHTVVDRPLLRAGETVSMKHFIRTETGPQTGGFGLPEHFPDTLVITHVGSGQEFTQPLAWYPTASGGRSALSEFALPRAARLGRYDIAFRQKGPQLGDIDSGHFRVEEFRLPVFQGSIDAGTGSPLVARQSLNLQVQLNYVSGGPASHLPVQLTAMATRWLPRFADHEDFSFEPPSGQRGCETADEDGDAACATTEAGEPSADGTDTTLIVDRQTLVLDAHGNADLAVEIPPAPQPRELLIEASHADPNGEIQTLHRQRILWPAAVVAGLRAEHWTAADRPLPLQALALDTSGRPQADVPLAIKAVSRHRTSSRKRMVGGFYAYDHHVETRDLGTVCRGRSNAHGLLECTLSPTGPGEIELVVTATDGQGNQHEAARTVWITRHGELWFGADNHDRMDVLPDRKEYAPGENARFQVRMPFRHATALVTVEREGIVDSHVVELTGDDPHFTLKVDESWSPNVHVSVLALRGRLRDVPWYSLFSWGYRNPGLWWQAWRQDNRGHQPPTALVDLSKPAYRMGLAGIRVNHRAHRLDVKVHADRGSYPVRDTARLTVEVRRPDGQPAAHAEVAIAAVDQALLELLPNTSWQLLDAMLAPRAWGVRTATAQMEIVGRRHYGRKAVPAGGDGGGNTAPTRELFDTLLAWQPRVPLDADGRAQVEIPLGDAISTFRVVAIADSGTSLFGTGETHIRSTQDLQIISGLPPLVRAGDRFRALLTLRNTTAQPMQVRVQPRATLLKLPERIIEIPPSEAREVHWDVTAPASPATLRGGRLLWEIAAHDRRSGSSDTLKISQQLMPAVPVQVQQASLRQLGGPLSLPVAMPASAVPGQGGLQLTLQASLADGLPGVRDWLARYPYSCLEQQASKAIGLRDATHWQDLMQALPAYLDGDGLPGYFTSHAGGYVDGSDVLAAWLLASTHQAAQHDARFALPVEMRQQMIGGLRKFVEGRIERRHWSPRADLVPRKLAAIEALSRFRAATPAMLESLEIAPARWPTSALIDWIGILQRLPAVPDRQRHLREARQVLRTRLSWQGSRVVLANEAQDDWWWLMVNGDVNAARLLLLALDEPGWQDDLGRLATGLLARQQAGAWQTTTANLWGSLAIEAFARRQEAIPVSGITRATLAGEQRQVDWSQPPAPAGNATPDDARRSLHQPGHDHAPLPAAHHRLLPWPADAAGHDDTLTVTHDGTGRPWLGLQSLAAVPRTAAVAAGYRIEKRIVPVSGVDDRLPAGEYRRGDVLRVQLSVHADTPMNWVAITDPIPAGSTILGSGLGRDGQLATRDETRETPGWQAYEERSFESFRSYQGHLPAGTLRLDYTLRLNNPGHFQLPPTRVEALYAPAIFGESPNAPVVVHPADP